jgi:predicted Zn-dependent protease
MVLQPQGALLEDFALRLNDGVVRMSALIQLKGSNTISRRHFLSALWFAITFAMLAVGTAYAQLPPGTSDASQPPAQKKVDPLLIQANEALGKQDYPTALKLLTTLAEKNPDSAPILYNLAFTQDALDQPAAEATYRKAIAVDPNYFDPHLGLGLLLARNDKRTEAHAELLKATTLTTDNSALKARAYRALARLDQTSNPALASDELLNALKFSSETPDDVLLSGELAEASGDSAAAEAAYRRVLAADPQNHDATAALTHLMLHQQKPDQAESLLTAALAKDPENPTLNAQLAALYEQQNKPAQAIPIAEKLHAAHPENPALTRLLAHLYVQDQQFDQAAPLYAKLVAASPQDPVLLDDYAGVLIHLKRYSEAETLLKQATANPSGFPTKEDLGNAAGHLAFAASANNDPGTTLQALTLRATVFSNSPSTLFLEATAHDKLHHIKQATDLYKEFLSVANGQFPDEEWEARHRLVTLEHMK